jgi:hypothetical protein
MMREEVLLIRARLLRTPRENQKRRAEDFVYKEKNFAYGGRVLMKGGVLLGKDINVR